ncbi:MAG: hypothetical protein D6798_17385 [Deltaproteobacteria bacterium]|nr:MAG: hypothetical protein D6798_17385 [Deltaproteobacteria bacterium]
MYGPPPDPRQVLAPVGILDVPEAYLGCLAVGGLLSAAAAWRRPPPALRYFLLILGQVIILTMPALWFIDSLVFGAFPTIDKEGSLLFYLDGVHVRMLLHPLLSTGDPAAHLIGVHTGHLWVTAFFDLFLSPIGAFNAQALLYPALAWYCAWLLLTDLCGHRRMSFVIAFAWGMGLHVFRDLNWYTIEKAAIFWLALFAWALHRAWQRTPVEPDPASADAPGADRPSLRRGRLPETGPWPWICGAVYLLMTWNNLYLGLVGAVFGATALAGVMLAAVGAWRQRSHRPRAWALAAARARNIGLSCAACALFVAPLVVWQVMLLSSGPSLGDPDRFLYERAALDSFTLVPFRWNRLEPWRALNLVVVGLALFGGWFRRRDPRVRYAVVTGTLLALLSLGPFLLPGVDNPIYMAARAVVPGFWRVAKPEVFFHGTWLLMCGVAAIQLARVVPRPRTLGALYLLFVVAWVVMVRTHPAYPDLTRPVHSELDPDWSNRVFR